MKTATEVALVYITRLKRIPKRFTCPPYMDYGGDDDDDVTYVGCVRETTAYIVYYIEFPAGYLH